jgi:uncharacterized protein (TIGR03083 family)
MAAPLPADADLSELIAAWQSAHDDFLDLLGGLTDEQWHTPTDLPGWSVADVVAHVTWLEALLIGEVDPPHEPQWSQLPHVTTDFGRKTERPVDLRRSWTREAVMVECRDVLARRSADLVQTPNDVETPNTAAFGPKTVGALVLQRTFDTWVHEQDIRQALALTGGWDTPGAQASARQLLPGLPMLWGKRAGASVGEVLHVTVTEPGVSFTAVVKIGDDGRARFVSDDLVDQAGPATVSITMPWHVFVVAACGRKPRTTWQEDVHVTGDPTLAERLLDNFTVTP